MDNDKDPEKLLLKWKSRQDLFEYTRQLVEGDGLPTYPDKGVKEFKVNIRPDESVGPAMFKKDPLIPGGFKANSLTIRAMRKDLFVLDSFMTELENNIYCESCRRSFDLQFWTLCPYCGKEP